MYVYYPNRHATTSGHISCLSPLSLAHLMLLVSVVMMVRVTSDEHVVQSTDVDDEGNNPHCWLCSVERMEWHEPRWADNEPSGKVVNGGIRTRRNVTM
jgi:hypothetical protein